MGYTPSVKTTLDISDDLFRAAKSRAAEQGVPFKQIVDSALRRYLGEDKPGDAAFQLRDGSFGRGGLRQGYSWETLIEHAYEDAPES